MLAIALILASASACAPGSSKKKGVVKDCVLPADQAGTLSGNWRVTPIPIAFHAGDFSDDEIKDILDAAGTWNSFFAESKGLAMIDTGGESARFSSAAKPATLCSQGILNGSSFTGNVVLYKSSAWPYSASAIALTSYCPTPATPLNNFYMAIMEVNYQGFFVAGKKVPDLRTIFAHEFGHLVGLNHSCETTARSGVPGCSSGSLPGDYYSALMFPIFGFNASGVGEQKRSLQSNDQGRANCLYDSG